MPSTISAGTTAGTAIAIAGDTTGNLAFQTNGTTTAMTITTSQNVGIGTTNPVQTLHVVGRGIVDNGTGTQNAFSVGTNSSGTGTGLGCIDINGTAYSALYLRANNIIHGQFTDNNGATIVLGTITNIPLIFQTNEIERGRFDTSGNFLFNSGYGSVATAYGCRAWVNFNGTTSPGTIRGSGNVTSVTKNGTGDYTINFTNSLPDTNYAVTGTVYRSFTNSTRTGSVNPITYATGSLRIGTSQTDSASGSYYDYDFVNVAIIR